MQLFVYQFTNLQLILTIKLNISVLTKTNIVFNKTKKKQLRKNIVLH